MTTYAPNTTWVRSDTDNKLYRDIPVHSYALHPPNSKNHPAWMVKSFYCLELITSLGSKFHGVLSGKINSELRMIVEIEDTDGVARDELKRKWEIVREENLV